MPTGSQTLRFLLAVAAFAVYIQINRSPLTSQLDASHCCFVCAWLIAIAQIKTRQLQARGLASKPATPAARIIILIILNKIYKLLVEKSVFRETGGDTEPSPSYL